MTRNKAMKESRGSDETSGQNASEGSIVGPHVTAALATVNSTGGRATWMRVLTHNIRYATSSPFKGEERWPIRCPRLCAELQFHSATPNTIICLQEVLHSQLLDIKASLNEGTKYGEDWAYIGVGRDDGRQAGEYSPIFYRPSEWNLEKWETIWLSETPAMPSKGWDAASTRIATFGYFTNYFTESKIIVTNTHFDDQGLVSRKKSAQLILKYIEVQRIISGHDVAILAGDFNSPVEEEAYQILTASDSSMVDVSTTLPKEKRYGNELTFTGFSEESTPSRIDFVFASKSSIGKEIDVMRYAVLANRFDDGVYISDHRACVAAFRLWLDY